MKGFCAHEHGPRVPWQVAALAVVFACTLSISALAVQAKGSRENPIRVGSLRIVGFAPSYLLPEMGTRLGVAFRVLDFPRTTERLAALLRGDIDIAFAGWNGLILMAERGDPVVAIANAFNGGYALVVRADSGIHRVEDLKGKRVAHSIGSNAELHLYSQLKLAGLQPGDVQAVHMGFPEMPLALARGDIDACFCSEPHASIAIHQGFGRLLKYPYDAGYRDINGVVVTTRRFLTGNRVAVKATVRAFVMATDMLKDNPDHYLQVGREMFRQPDPVVQLALKNTKLDYSVDISAVKAMMEWQLRLGLIKRKPRPDHWVDLSILREVLAQRR